MQHRNYTLTMVTRFCKGMDGPCETTVFQTTFDLGQMFWIIRGIRDDGRQLVSEVQIRETATGRTRTLKMVPRKLAS